MWSHVSVLLQQPSDDRLELGAVNVQNKCSASLEINAAVGTAKKKTFDASIAGPFCLVVSHGTCDLRCGGTSLV